VEAKVREKAERKRIIEQKKKKKKRTLNYLQQLQNEVLAENTTFLESAEGSQIIESKHKEIPLENDRDCQPSKKTKEKQLTRYYRDNRIKIGGANSCERCVHAGQNCLVHNSR